MFRHQGGPDGPLKPKVDETFRVGVLGKGGGIDKWDRFYRQTSTQVRVRGLLGEGGGNHNNASSGGGGQYQGQGGYHRS